MEDIPISVRKAYRRLAYSFHSIVHDQLSYDLSERIFSVGHTSSLLAKSLLALSKTAPNREALKEEASIILVDRLGDSSRFKEYLCAGKEI